ncbi:flagellar biosynthesis protein FliR [Marinilactibacillus psychrotolerans]|uniref:Flagellar biosynthetic protein FliR n=2 Tax=Marinilactibacillus TaxID=191769 RepID=A0A1I3V8J3_9LACT|nr:flagellar biosynthesis protein FliR [Marinilactibacillus psychrotolerans]SFJ90686.1 flagellar biosynthetic protein FliR [Marinilactibacillus piezotolerans]
MNSMIDQLQHFLLILIRITTFISLSPGFSNKAFPQVAKLGISFALSFTVMGFIDPIQTPFTIGLFLLLGIKELFIGMALAYITILFFTAVDIAGSLVDFQVGFSMGQIYDPSLGVSASNFGKIYYWISIAIFFIANIHHIVIRSLVKSFEYVPLNQIVFNSFGVEGIVKLFGHVFEIALSLAIPFIIVALLSELTLALISRTVPQINVLILGIPMKILVSLVFMFIFLPMLMENISEIFPEMIKYMDEFLNSLSN